MAGTGEFNVQTEAATNINPSDITLNGNVPSLYMSVEEVNAFDAAILYWEWGQMADLSDGARIPDADDHAIFAADVGVTKSYFLDGLSEDTEYFFRAIANSVHYADSASMATAAASAGFMEGLADNETDMDKVTDSEMNMDKVTDSEVAMDKVMADVMPRTKMLLSEYVTADEDCKIWSKEMASSKVFKSVDSFTGEYEEVENGWDSTDGEVKIRYGTVSEIEYEWGSFEYEGSEPESSDIILAFSPQGSYQGRHTIGWKVDLTDVSKIHFEHTHKMGHSSRPQEIIIDDEVVFNCEVDQDWTKSDIDVSAMSGEVKLELGFGDGLDHDDVDRWIGFTGIYFG